MMCSLDKGEKVPESIPGGIPSKSERPILGLYQHYVMYPKPDMVRLLSLVRGI